MTRPTITQWVAANGGGEMLGLGLGALVGIPGQLWLESHLPALAAAVLAATAFALVEGGIVGVAQGSIVHRLDPRVSVSRWVAATTAGGWVAWLAVSVPFALGAGAAAGAGSTEPPLVLQLAAMAFAGLAAGPVLALPQALVLRAAVPAPWPWVWANAKAWAVGLPLIQLVAGGLPAGWPLPAYVVVAALVLFTSGALVGRIHGPTLWRLLGQADTASPASIRSNPAAAAGPPAR